MMFLGKDLIGNPVIGVRNGRILGHVKDLYLDKDLNNLAGLYLGGTGLLNRQHHFVERNKVTTIGKDTVLILSPEAIEESDDPAASRDWLRRDDIQGRNVDTPGGTKIGTVDDVILTRQGHVAGFSLGQILVNGPIAEKKAVARQAVLDTGLRDGQMTIDLPTAETQELMVIEPPLFSGGKKVTTDPETAVSDPTTTPYTEEKPSSSYATHAPQSEEDYKSPYVTKEGETANHADTSPYISPESDEAEEDEAFKSPYTTPEGV